MVENKVKHAGQAAARRAAEALEGIERGVISKYTSIEDRFVAAYLTREGESVADAKKRLRLEEQARRLGRKNASHSVGAVDGGDGDTLLNGRTIRSGQSFLYRSGGYNSTVVEVRMAERVTAGNLQAALTKVSRRFPYLMQKLVEVDGVYHLVDDHNSLVAKRTRGYRQLGSMATGYHLIDVTYIDNLIRVAFHHGLCDGGGIKPFVESLIYYYCCDKYHREFSSEGIRTVGQPIAPGEYTEPFGSEPFAIEGEVSKAEHVDEVRLPEATTTPLGCWRTQFVLDEATFVAASKRIGATPSIMLALVLSHAIARVLPAETLAEKAVVCNVAVDYRHAIGADATHCNCVGSVALPLTAADDAAGWEATAHRWRALLAAAREPNTVRAALNKQIGLFNRLEQTKGLEAKRSMMSFFDSLLSDTYTLSYLGRLRLNDYAEHVESACFYSGNRSGISLSVLAAAGKFCIDMHQGFPGDRYVRAFEDALRPYGLISISATEQIVTGRDAAHTTAGRQGERFALSISSSSTPR